MVLPWLIVQYDNRKVDKKLQKLVERNKQYAQKHDYEYIFETKTYDLPPWWIKVKLVQEKLLTNKYKGILWLDTDATVYNIDKSLYEIILPGKSFYFSPDCPRNGIAPFNAGVWLVINDTNGKNIMDTWIHMYNPADWHISFGKWVTSGIWAGSSYEQGAFKDKIIPVYNSYIHQYDWTFLQSYYISNSKSDIFTVHFAWDLKNLFLDDFLKKIRPKYNYIYLVLLCLLFLYLLFLCLLLFNLNSKYINPISRFFKNATNSLSSYMTKY